MSKFKVGQMVIIDVPIEEIDDWSEDIKSYIGARARITRKLSIYNNWYELDIDGGLFQWNDNELRALQAGDKIKVNGKVREISSVSDIIGYYRLKIDDMNLLFSEHNFESYIPEKEAQSDNGIKELINALESNQEKYEKIAEEGDAENGFRIGCRVRRKAPDHGVATITGFGVGGNLILTCDDGYKIAAFPSKWELIPKNATKPGDEKNISETLIIGYDRISDGFPTAAMTISKANGSSVNYIATFYGEEAETLYEKLTRRM